MTANSKWNCFLSVSGFYFGGGFSILFCHLFNRHTFRLIARMLVREPDKRATLEEIAHSSWLGMDEEEEPQLELLPLVSREQVSDDDHTVIIQKMANGNIASKEEIIE